MSALLPRVTRSVSSSSRCSTSASGVPMRTVSTRVLPLPAPAITMVGPSVASTAARWAAVLEEEVRREALTLYEQA